MSRWGRRSAGACAAALALSACASTGPTGSERPLTVVAAFYPLEYLAQQVGGDRVSVRSLAQPGAEPHDLELSPRDVAAISTGDLVVYLDGFQPAVDDAVAAEAPDTGWDASAYADLDLAADGGEADGGDESLDPHFWLDPVRYSQVADALADQLAALDPDGAAAYRANATDLGGRLQTLDAEWTAGTTACASRDLVTAHTAFGYLAQRYNLTQVGIAGLAAEGEPSPKALADLAAFIEANDVQTVYFETLASPAVAKTLAAETGARTAVLDPIEGITDESAGDDYIALMRANLASVREGQPCP